MEGELLALAQEQGAHFKTEAGAQVGGHPAPGGGHRRRQQGHGQHLPARAENGVHIPRQNAQVHHVGNQGRDEQRTHHLAQQKEQGQRRHTPVPLVKGSQVFHEGLLCRLAFFTGKRYHKP